MATHSCPSCGRQVRDGARFCTSCGAAQSLVAPTQRIALPVTMPPQTNNRLAVSRKTIFATAAGLLGGLIASAILSLLNVRAAPYSQFVLALLVGLVAGTLIPGAINTVPGFLSGQPRRALQNGTVAAGISGVIMTLVSLGLASLVPRAAIFFQGSFVLGLLTWLLFGLALGVAEGLVWRSPQRALLGAVGGAIGALLAFVIGTLLDNEGAFVLVGPLIGLGANLLPDIFKTAWVSVVCGRREFDIALDKSKVVFGSSDDSRQADVGLFGGGDIAPRHFMIERRDDNYILTRLPQPRPVLLNGTPTNGSKDLQSGDVIEVGKAQIRFYTKEGR